MSGNAALNRANKAKEDEFYTQLSDIESELKHYRKHFSGKTVLCNCDDPFESNFFKYFCLNFNRLKLKKLIATCYSGSPITGNELTLFGDDTEEARRTPYKAVVTSVHDADGDGAT
ncbi:adenine-specific methyltransferase EcoRI family protein, partial [Phocaeicola faecium]